VLGPPRSQKYWAERYCLNLGSPKERLIKRLQAGGKEESAQGVGLNDDQVQEALAAARQYLSSIST
jgi:hypothetical protein